MEDEQGRFSVYQDELNGILEELASVGIVERDTEAGPFDAVYQRLAETILSCSNTYVILRFIEDAMLDDS